MLTSTSSKFSKYQGAGNDFILIDDRALLFSSPIAPLCNRKTGIGADGLILLQPSTSASFRMRIFNADGTEPTFCGNGLRCLGLFLLDLGLPKKTYTIETGNHLAHIYYKDLSVYTILCPLPEITLIDDLYLLNTGVPHIVQFTPIPNPLLRHKYNANINAALRNPDASFNVRTFERGVEEETLACGSGAAAVATVAYYKWNQTISLLHFPGGTLQVSLIDNHLHLTGPASKVFEGKL